PSANSLLPWEYPLRRDSAMMNLLNRWFRPRLRSRPRRRDKSHDRLLRARPMLEALEDRVTPAITPTFGPPPFVSTALGPPGEVLEVVRPDGTLTQYDIGGAHALGS